MADIDDDDDQPLSAEEARKLRDALAEQGSRLEAERRRADTEANRADELQSQVRTTSGHLANATVAGLEAQGAAAEQSISAIDQEITGYRRQQAELFAEGKFEEATELSEKIGDATARRQALRQSKSVIEQRRTEAAAAPADPVEGFLTRNNFNDAEKQWIRSNPRYATDRGFWERVNAEHQKALDAGVEPHSPAYFKRLADAGYMRQAPAAAADPGQRQQQRQPAADGGTPEDTDGESPYSEAAGGEEAAPSVVIEPAAAPAPARQQTRTPMAAAPSRRSPGAPVAGQRQVIRLTSDEAEAALAMSDQFPAEVQEAGDEAIYAHYQKLKTSPMAQRKKLEWANGA